MKPTPYANAYRVAISEYHIPAEHSLLQSPLWIKLNLPDSETREQSANKRL